MIEEQWDNPVSAEDLMYDIAKRGTYRTPENRLDDLRSSGALCNCKTSSSRLIKA